MLHVPEPLLKTLIFFISQKVNISCILVPGKGSPYRMFRLCFLGVSFPLLKIISGTIYKAPSRCYRLNGLCRNKSALPGVACLGEEIPRCQAEVTSVYFLSQNRRKGRAGLLASARLQVPAGGMAGLQSDHRAADYPQLMNPLYCSLVTVR